MIVEARLQTRTRLLGLLPLTLFILHFLYYARYGGLSYICWVCNLGNLLLAVGLLFGRPELIRVAVFWLIPGLPLWLWFTVLQGGWLLTSALSHIGGLITGLLALKQVGAGKRTWIFALGWFLLLQLLSRSLTPPELNVNIAHEVYPGWEDNFAGYWTFWLASTGLATVGCWALGIVLWSIFPPPPAQPVSRARPHCG
ncbi:MAG: hypothetical protein HY650_01100 [Acidobacteria bacterium]|nr:hypothetical protein [Acidobacteriota bacterium]